MNDKLERISIIEFNKRFANGEQHLILNGEYLIDELPTYFWQENAVFNKIQPIVEMFKAKKPKLTEEEIYGKNGLVDALIPLQRAYNTIKNRKYEMINRMAFGNLFIEDGSVDTNILETEGLQPGKILIYRQGSKTPEMIGGEFNFTAIENEEKNLLNEMQEIVKSFKLKWGL